jgi:hypothetical protein
MPRQGLITLGRVTTQKRIVHADLKTTQIYTHVSIRQLKLIHSATHPAKLEAKTRHKEMRQEIKLLDVVVLTENLPDRKLRCGQVGTVVEWLDPCVFEVEFTDNDGRAFASLALKESQLLVL